VGELLRAGLADPRVTEIRGRGLLIGIDVDAEAAPHIVEAGQQAGFILNSTGPRTIRLAPPLVLTEEQAKELVAAWPGLLDSAYSALEGATR
jgi:acetylornithine aminotransferase